MSDPTTGAFSVCECSHAVIDHQRFSDHDKCTIGECECDRVRPIHPTTTGEQDRFVMRDHAIFDTKADAFIGAGDACYLLNEINAMLAAERENVEIAHKGMDHYHDQAEQLAALVEALIGLCEDWHHTSMRPCSTCERITKLISQPFGCYWYQEKHKNNPALAKAKEAE